MATQSWRRFARAGAACGLVRPPARDVAAGEPARGLLSVGEMPSLVFPPPRLPLERLRNALLRVRGGWGWGSPANPLPLAAGHVAACGQMPARLLRASERGRALLSTDRPAVPCLSSHPRVAEPEPARLRQPRQPRVSCGCASSLPPALVPRTPVSVLLPRGFRQSLYAHVQVLL